MQISELMKANPTMISPESTIEEAARKMKAISAGILPVGDKSETLGMITDRDIAIRATAEGKSCDTKVRDVMTADVVMCEEDCAPREAFEKMREHNIGRLLVVNPQGKVTGIVSMADLIGSASNDVWDCIEHAAQHGVRRSA